MNYRLPALIGPLGALGCLLAACSADTQVSLTGNTPAQYSHVWVTTQELWFNSSSTAGPADGGWVKFTLSTPTTIDLVGANNGNLSNITDDLRIVPATYSQLRVVPVDASTPLTSSAQTAGALYNSEADFVDSTGLTHQLPLELLNPDQGFGIATSLKVPVGNVGAALSSTDGSTATDTGTTDTGTTLGTTTGTTTGATTGTTTGVGSTASSQPPNEFAVFLDGTTDLVPFSTSTYTGGTGIMLSQHASAYDLSRSAGISGQLTLTNITTSSSGLPAIQVSAQVLSADGTRHVVVASAPVQADGSFMLYPLPANSNNVTYYDVVIHGPGIATIIIESVQVELPSSSSSALSSDTTSTTGTTTGTTTATTGTTTLGTTTTGTTTVGTTTPTTSTASTTGTAASINSVALGTLTPRAATSYTANLATTPAATLPAGSLVGFYQTLQGSGEVPYLIEASPIDPFNEVLQAPQALSTGTVDSGTWSSATSGGTITVVSAPPVGGAGTYIVAASAPGYANGALTPKVTAPTTTPPSGTTAPPVTVALSTLPLAAGTPAGTLHASLTLTTPGKYNAGQLLVSQNGTLVATAPLPAGFGSGTASVAVSGLPAEIPSALYLVSVRVWNTSDPTGSLQRQWSDEAVDLRSATSGSITFAVD
jgi:mucin-2